MALESFVNLTMSLAVCPARANTNIAERFCCSMAFCGWKNSLLNWKERGWLDVYASNILSGNDFLNPQQLKFGFNLSACMYFVISCFKSTLLVRLRIYWLFSCREVTPPHTDTIKGGGLSMTLNCIQCSGTLRMVKHLFVAFNSRSILSRSDWIC